MSGNEDSTPRTAAGGGRLAGQTVLITGAGSGLGRESALLFGAEGANVVVTDLIPARVDRVVEQVRPRVARRSASRPTSGCRRTLFNAVALAVRTYERLDVLMCSAGVPEEGFGTLVPLQSFWPEGYLCLTSGTGL